MSVRKALAGLMQQILLTQVEVPKFSPAFAHPMQVAFGPQVGFERVMRQLGEGQELLRDLAAGAPGSKQRGSTASPTASLASLFAPPDEPLDLREHLLHRPESFVLPSSVRAVGVSPNRRAPSPNASSDAAAKSTASNGADAAQSADRTDRSRSAPFARMSDGRVVAGDGASEPAHAVPDSPLEIGLEFRGPPVRLRTDLRIDSPVSYYGLGK